MSTRRSHLKSRNGCRTCKKRRVKCDEQGPPCTNCVIRKTPCSYGDADAETATTTTAASGSSGARLSPSPAAPPSRSRHLLELELMHRYSTSTYKSVCSLAAEAHLMQVLVPREALRHPFAMHGLFAFAAFDLAMSSSEAGSGASSRGLLSWPPPAGTALADYYARAAFEYYERALPVFRELLPPRTTRENHLAMFMFSNLTVAVSFIRPQLPPPGMLGPSVRESVLAAFDCLVDATAVITASWDWLAAGPVQLHAFIEQKVPYELLDGDTKAAISRLHSVNDGFYRHRPGAQQEENSGPQQAAGTSPAAAAAPASDHDFFQSAILHLEGSFARDVEGTVKGTCISWLALLGARFGDAFRRGEPVAVIILMHWAVLLHNYGRGVWWASGAGRDLVVELSAELQRSQLASQWEWQEAISWARKQVSLPDMVF